MAGRGVDLALFSVGADLPYLIGYDAMNLPRLTMLVVPRDGDATLVIPNLEVARVVERPGVFGIRGWAETEDPIDIVAGLSGSPSSVAVGDQTWARNVVDLLGRLPGARWSRATELVGPLRARKDPAEVEALRTAAQAADRVAAQLHAGEIPLVGHTEAEVSAELSRRLLAEGHTHVNFAIVAAGPHAASPHHEAGATVIRPGEVVLCDFGGSFPMADGEPGYCSDITRCVYTGEPPGEFAELYAVLWEAQSAAVAAGTVGTPAEEVDGAARRVITAAGFGDRFIHRTGHGIGIFEHEDPYIVAGNGVPLEGGNAFSIEPGIYLPGRFGARLEDIVVATDDGPDPLNVVEHGLVVVEA
ncbi:MAG: M24 family metallopeptidase [Acidimicrobiia bacterium]|nr:M24 family metallopeptidase [Acidimicrobiia bacterium]